MNSISNSAKHYAVSTFTNINAKIFILDRIVWEKKMNYINEINEYKNIISQSKKEFGKPLKECN